MTREAKDNIDLTKILKDCPKGEKFWSPLFGEVEFVRHWQSKGFFNVRLVDNEVEEWSFTYKATIFLGTVESEEIMIYPSRDQRDWSKFEAPWYKKDKFDTKTLQPFDKVIARVDSEHSWNIDFFSCFRSVKIPYCLSGIKCAVLPYNDETKYLVGTKDEAPEFYRYWDD